MNKRNQNRPGYKETKVGWIPEDWNAKKIGSILDRMVDPVKVELEATYQEIGIRSHGKGMFDKSPVTGKRLGNKKVFWVHADCFILNIVFAWEQALDKTKAYDVGKIASHRFPMYRPKNKNLNVDYLVYYFKTPRGKYLLGLASPGGAGRNKTLGQKEFSSILVPLPHLLEQKKIAAILSTWDEAIDQTNRLIDARKRRKKALMQKLLSGKMRLKIYKKSKADAELESHEWEVVRFNQAFKRILRTTTSDVMDVLSITARVGFVHQKDKFNKVIAGENLQRYILLLKDDFAYNKGNSKYFPQGCIYKLENYERAAVPNVYFCFHPRTNKVYGDFYKFYFENGMLNRQLQRVINTGVRNDGLLNLNPKDFFNIKICVPPIKEQKKIADIFTSANEEISILEKKLIALKIQKRGLMQKLLTGEIRVKT